MAKKPLKPERPVSSIVFPKKGRPYLRVERLPRTQQNLELAIGKKFLGALAHFWGEIYTDLRQGSGHCDLICRKTDGSEIEIQVVEVVNQNLRLLQRMRGSYSGAVATAHRDVLEAFRGCVVTLVDSGDPPLLPGVATAEGKNCLAEIVEGLRNMGLEIGTLGLRRIRRRTLSIGRDMRHVSVLCERWALAHEENRFAFQWVGGGPSYRTDQPRGLLSGVVKQKIGKRYSKPRAIFWLLAYSTDTLFDGLDPDVVQTRELLAAAAHPFHAAWFLYPYNDMDLGHLVRIWPEGGPDGPAPWERG